MALDSEILYYFDQFGHHASQGKWIWPKSVACPRSQKQWSVSKNHWSKRPKFTFFSSHMGSSQLWEGLTRIWVTWVLVHGCVVLSTVDEIKVSN